MNPRTALVTLLLAVVTLLACAPSDTPAQQSQPEAALGGGGDFVAAAPALRVDERAVAPAPRREDSEQFAWTRGVEPEAVVPAPPAFPPPDPWGPAPRRRNAVPPPEIGGVAAVVVDEASGAVMYGKDEHIPLAPASLTKIVTAIVAIEQGDLNAWVDNDVDGSNMGRGTVMGILPGDRFRLRDLLYGLMLPSGNDAALSIGRHIAGSDRAFVDRMNRFVVSLGLRGSHFANPHGLGGAGHATSAYDLAMISRYGMTLPDFVQIAGTGSWVARGSRVIAMSNLNGFLFSYPGADGIKVGYTRTAGPTLVASATRNGHRLYAVVLNSVQRDYDARILLDWAFAGFCWPQAEGAPCR